jgi:hypothetical protein
MSATTYYADTATDPLDAAQRDLDVHTISSLGYCMACKILGPCRARERAESVFERSLRLPRRRPGHTRPELLGARRIGAASLDRPIRPIAISPDDPHSRKEARGETAGGGSRTG